MKYWKPLAMAFLTACTPGADRTQHDEAEAQDSTHIVLYNQVMDIHDEVMPKMEDLYNMKKDIEEELKNTKGMAAEQRQKLEKKVAQIDSVSKLMMDWMHEFNPPPDSADAEEKRTYLERELERVRVVKQAMLETIDQGTNQQ
jgi:hypothetical protein